MTDKEENCGLAVEDSFVTWNRLRIESAAMEDIKEASDLREIEQRVLDLETRVVELERTAKK